jgi:uncharacterized protein YkwD
MVRLGWFLVLMAGCRPAAPVVERAPSPAQRSTALDERPAATREAAPGHRALARLAAGLDAALDGSRLEEVARAAAESASADFVVSASAVRAAMAKALGSGAWPHVLTARGRDDEIATQLEDGLAELRAATQLAEVGFAIASGPAGRVGVLVALPPPRLPLAVERSGRAARITLPWQGGNITGVYAVAPTVSHRLAIERSGDALAVAVDCSAPAAIEIRDGARVIATVLDACAPELATDPPPPGVEIGPPARTPIEIEMRVWDLVNRERVAHGLAALGWDTESHRFARAHAADMARFRYVGHQTPLGASYAERIAAAPFRSRSSRENVGHAWGPGEVHEAFLHSAGHRENLMAGDVDRGAIGVAVDPEDARAFYISEFFRR